jgi:glycosyltransferase involved in cell wall biosynthesis
MTDRSYPNRPQKRSKRIAILFPVGQQRGGAEALMIHYLRFNADLGRDLFVLVFLRDGPMPDLARSLGYDVRVIVAKRLRNIFNFIHVIWQLDRLFRSEDIGIVLSWMSKVHLYASFPARIRRIPTIWYQHGISDGGMLDKVITGLPATLVICCSKAVAAAQSKLSVKRKMRVVYPAVDLNRLQSVDPDRQRARLQLGIDWQGPIVAMFARFERWKGIDVFIDSAMQMSQVRKEIKFVVVGGAQGFDTEYRSQIERRVAGFNFEGRLLLAGQKSMDEVALWMTAADIIVHPVTGEEPFGMVIVEAMALGRPVIASATGGIPEIIENGVNGVLIAPNDLEALTTATAALLDDPELRNRLGDNARSRAREFSTEKLVASLDSVFDSVRG